MPNPTLKAPLSLDVYANSRKVGTLAELPDHRIAFEYSPEWLQSGFSISPFSLPLKSGVFIPKSYEPFDGLFGVFSDSLPDGWGALLTDRLLRSKGIDPYSLSTLARLSLIGKNGKGLLEYCPSQALKESFHTIDFDELAKECEKILDDQPSKDLDALYGLGGSSGGARPKINTFVDGEEWIIKFRTHYDSTWIGQEEFDYFTCAKSCQIEVPEFRLFPSKTSPGYFGCVRFDRSNQEKIHMVSAGALLETNYRIPNLDYEILLKLTWLLTNDMEEVIRMFRLACFNVFSHNRDDHAKNFSFLYKDGRWRLSPAYDLTWSSSFGGEHATTIHGNGKNPGPVDLQQAASSIGIPSKAAQTIIQKTKANVEKMLKNTLQKHRPH